MIDTELKHSHSEVLSIRISKEVDFENEARITIDGDDFYKVTFLSQEEICEWIEILQELKIK